MKAQWNNSRRVSKRVFVCGTLELETPAHFGNGDDEGLTDISLQRDALDGRPLLTGASIAGALRNYLREHELGFGIAEQADGATLAEQLFGHLVGDESAREGWLFVDDALEEALPVMVAMPIELRDGVAIDPKTRTAEIDEEGKGNKFDIELLSAGTKFDVKFELWLPDANSDALLRAFAIALSGLEKGKIRLGTRKRRGFGKCKVTGWHVVSCDMHTKQGLKNWLEYTPGTPAPGSIATLLGVQTMPDHAGKSFIVDATFGLDPDSSLLIRSGSGLGDEPDMVHLRSWRNGTQEPILSGTSLAGALRARALKIANTLMQDDQKAKEFVDGLFGRRITGNTDEPSGSAILVDEVQIGEQGRVADRVQNRVKIDRFTGGAYPQGLFAQQPVFGDSSTEMKINLELRETPLSTGSLFKAQVGLLLLVLKDVWTGDVALGGESSVGRGLLCGKRATLKYGGDTWEITGNDSVSPSPDKLETEYLKAFKEVCRG